LKRNCEIKLNWIKFVEKEKWEKIYFQQFEFQTKRRGKLNWNSKKRKYENERRKQAKNLEDFEEKFRRKIKFNSDKNKNMYNKKKKKTKTKQPNWNTKKNNLTHWMKLKKKKKKKSKKKKNK